MDLGRHKLTHSWPALFAYFNPLQTHYKNLKCVGIAAVWVSVFRRFEDCDQADV
jgi:hypothetical protein